MIKLSREMLFLSAAGIGITFTHFPYVRLFVYIISFIIIAELDLDIFGKLILRCFSLFQFKTRRSDFLIIGDAITRLA